MMALANKTNYVPYNPSTCVCHFLNGVIHPLLAQAKFSLDANHDQYSGNFDVTIK